MLVLMEKSNCLIFCINSSLHVKLLQRTNIQIHDSWKRQCSVMSILKHYQKLKVDDKGKRGENSDIFLYFTFYLMWFTTTCSYHVLSKKVAYKIWKFKCWTDKSFLLGKTQKKKLSSYSSNKIFFVRVAAIKLNWTVVGKWNDSIKKVIPRPTTTYKLNLFAKRLVLNSYMVVVMKRVDAFIGNIYEWPSKLHKKNVFNEIFWSRVVVVVFFFVWIFISRNINNEPEKTGFFCL